MTASRDPVELLVLANDEFARRLRLVGPDDWRRPTPCSEWDVRALVNHVVGANVRYQLLLHGAPTEQVEATRTVDHLGDAALASFVVTADGVVARFHEDGAGDDNSGARALVLRTKVADGSTLPPRPHPLNPRAARGRGLQMVEALTTGWRHTLTATGKTVWAELAPGTLSVPSPP